MGCDYYIDEEQGSEVEVKIIDHSTGKVVGTLAVDNTEFDSSTIDVEVEGVICR